MTLLNFFLTHLFQYLVVVLVFHRGFVSAMGMDPDRIVESFYIFEYGFLRFFHCFEMVEVDPFSLDQ